MESDFFQQWLTIVCQQMTDCESAALFTFDGQSNDVKVVSKWPIHQAAGHDLSELAKKTLEKGKPLHVPVNDDNGLHAFSLVSCPVVVESLSKGMIVIKVKPLTQAQIKTTVYRLRQSSRWVGLAEHCQGVDDGFYFDVVSLLAFCFEQETFELAMLKLVSILCSKFDCDRVGFGEVKSGHSQVLTLSGSAEFDKKSNLVKLLSDAMNEALEQDSVIVYPEKNVNLIVRCHSELVRRYGVDGACTFPMAYGGQYFGVVTLLTAENKELNDRAVTLCQQFLSMVAPFLAEKKEQEKSVVLKLLRSGLKSVEAVVKPKYLKLKIAALLVIGVFLYASIDKDDYRVSANAVLEGKVQRVVAAPISGYLLSTSVRAGDTVKEGEELARLNDSDLLLEKAKLEGELQKLQREFRKAQSRRNLVDVSVVKEQVIQAKAEIDLNEEQLSKTRLLAPFDGVVIEGELQQMLGTPIERGDILFKLAPLEGYRTILKVEEQDIAHITEGQSGQLLLSSLPNNPLDISVEKIIAVSKTDSGKNIFRVEASLKDAPDLLRPGMEGVGKINTGEESLLWIWTHRIKDSIRLWFWQWLP